MVPNIERGHSFKGVTAYLMHDKAAGGGPQPDTAERVGFAGLFNFVGDEAVSIAEASKVMALTVRDADELKAAAGIKPGGRRAEKGPVWHASLSWDPSEQPTDEEMVDAAHSMLEKVGLPLKSGYQTYIVQHTDTEHRHIHVVVNLVHPINGKQANPYRDLPKAQAWAHAYDKARGNVFCKNRAEKYDRLSPGTTRPDAFQAAAALSKPSPDQAADKPIRARRPRQTRPEWHSRREAGNDNRRAQALAAQLREEISRRYAELKTSHGAGFERRRAETSRFYTDAKAGRQAIYEKYREALEDVWKGRRPQVPPDPARAYWQRLSESLSHREAVFLVQEGTLAGRLRNAIALGKGLSSYRLARLALNSQERRRLFEREQRDYKARNRPTAELNRVAAPKPESRKELSDRIRALRLAELSLFDKGRAADRAALATRHGLERDHEQAQRAALGRQAAELWQLHRTQYGRGSPAYTGRTGGERPLDPAMPGHGEGRGVANEFAGRAAAEMPEAARRPSYASAQPAGRYAHRIAQTGFDPNVRPQTFREKGPELER